MRVCWASGMPLSSTLTRLISIEGKGNIFTLAFSANNRYLYAYVNCLDHYEIFLINSS